MGIFGFFTSKTKDTSSTKSKTLIVLDWDKINTIAGDFSFLKPYEHKVVWIFSRHTRDLRNANLVLPFEYSVQEIPTQEGYYSNALMYKVLYEICTKTDYAQLVLVTQNDTYNGFIEFIKSENIVSVTLINQFAVRTHNANKAANSFNETRSAQPNATQPFKTQGREPIPNRNTEQYRTNNREQNHAAKHDLASKNIRTRDANTHANDTTKPQESQAIKPQIKKAPASIEPTNNAHSASKTQTQTPTHATNANDKLKIIHLIKNKFKIGEIYPKALFGMIVNQATDKTVLEVFNTRSARRFIAVLEKNGCVEEVDAQNYRFLKVPTLEVLQTVSQTEHEGDKKQGYKASPAHKKEITNPELSVTQTEEQQDSTIQKKFTGRKSFPKRQNPSKSQEKTVV